VRKPVALADEGVVLVPLVDPDVFVEAGVASRAPTHSCGAPGGRQVYVDVGDHGKRRTRIVEL
jgi:hypothetical protein